MDCIFCGIANGSVPSRKIYEDDDILAFLDINPANPGHVLVMPKKHIVSIYDADDETLKKLIVVVKDLATKIKEVLGADGMNIMQNNGRDAGQLVGHIHFHIIPRHKGDDVYISYKRKQLSEQQLDEICNKLKEKKDDYGDMYRY
ncbi:MAG: HIT family protein [Candidatus Aenigmatarchaeota archaeon]